MSIGMFSLQGDNHFFIIFGLLVLAGGIILFLLACMATQEERLRDMRVQVGEVQANLVKATLIIEAFDERSISGMAADLPNDREKGRVVGIDGAGNSA